MRQVQGTPIPPDEDAPIDPPSPQADVQGHVRRAGIQIDGFRIKVDDLKLSEIGEPTPKSWFEVRDAVHAMLKSIAVRIRRLKSDGFPARG
jgi:hypothetical protein